MAAIKHGPQFIACKVHRIVSSPFYNGPWIEISKHIKPVRNVLTSISRVPHKINVGCVKKGQKWQLLTKILPKMVRLSK
jgi:hypothetical protein